MATATVTSRNNGLIRLYLCILTVLVSNVASETDFSVYNETFFWNGDLMIPRSNDPFGRMFIQMGRIYVELPNNVSQTLDTLIRAGVDTTFDCGLLINTSIPAGSPTNLIGARTTTWYFRRRDASDNLATENTTDLGPSVQISGTNDRFLRVPEPRYATQAELSNAGLFVCEFCYEILSPLDGSVTGRDCSQAKVDLKIIGDPPTIRTGDIAITNARRIGRTICMNEPLFSLDFIQVVCAQNVTIVPVPVASYTLNGIPTTDLSSVFFTGQGVQEPGLSNNIILVPAGFRSMFPQGGQLRCFLENPFGNDTEITNIVPNTMVTNFGIAVDGTAGTPCPGRPSNVYCPRLGETVNLTCITNNNNPYNITGASRSSQDMSLVFAVTANDYGNYTCMSSNDCNSVVSSTIIIEECTPPDVTVTTERGNGASAPACYREDNDLFVRCADSFSGSTVDWYINGVLNMTNASNRLQVTSVGNYSCVTTAACGTSIRNDTIISSMPVINTGVNTVITNPGTNVVLVGSNPCISAGSSVRLRCGVANPDVAGAVSRTWQRDGSFFSNSEDIIVTSSGTYTCFVVNTCGMATASSTVTNHPEIRKGTGTVTTDVDIGSNMCLNNRDTGMIRCNLISGSGTRQWLNGGSVIPGQTGPSLTVSRSDIGTTFTCRVTNPCSTDSATTIVSAAVSANITGTIMGLPSNDNGCNRPQITAEPGVDLCPLDGERVTISCPTEGNAVYTISGPGGQVAINVPLVITTFDRNVHTGSYTCVVPSSMCGTITVLISVSGSGVAPIVSTIVTPGGAPPTLPPNTDMGTAIVGTDICLTPSQSVTIRCNTITGTPPINFTWTIPPNDTVISRSVNLTVSELGTYRCTAVNVFGSSAANTSVLRLQTVNLTATSPSGNRCSGLKRPPTGIDHCAFLSDRLYLNCTTNDPRVMTQIFPDGSSGSFVFSSVMVSHEGTYICNATNDCGDGSDAVTIAVYDPARIIRMGTLPTPGPNEVVIGADRQTDPTTVSENSTVILHCPYTGIEAPNTTWLRVRRDGFAVPIDTSNPSYSVTNDGTTAILTINDFDSSLAGSYRCFTTNNAGDDTADVVLQIEIPVTPLWITSPWTKCSPMCHRGMRMRIVQCINNVTGSLIPENLCPDPKPLTMEACTNLGPCYTTPTWRANEWGKCSRDCNGGHRTRSIDCLIPATGELVSWGRCNQRTQPHDSEYCNTHPCCQKDEYSFCEFYVSECHKDLMKRHCCWTCRGY